mgnify:CR=1 FL=1
MERTMKVQLHLVTDKTETQTLQAIQKFLVKGFDTNTTLKTFKLVEVIKTK